MADVPPVQAPSFVDQAREDVLQWRATSVLGSCFGVCSGQQPAGLGMASSEAEDWKFIKDHPPRFENVVANGALSEHVTEDEHPDLEYESLLRRHNAI